MGGPREGWETARRLDGVAALKKGARKRFRAKAGLFHRADSAASEKVRWSRPESSEIKSGVRSSVRCPSRRRAGMSRPVHWSFSGAGLLGGYFVGVWERLVAGDVPSALFCPARSRFVGTSAGSFVAVACASGVSQADAADTFARLLQSVHNASPLRGAPFP